MKKTVGAINNRQQGISLITLIITIIVIIILAAIVIFTGLNTPDRAQLAKFAQEFSGFQEAVTNAFLNEKMKLSTSGQYRTDEQIYYKIATGTDTTGTPTIAGSIADLNLSIGPEAIQGTNYYKITQTEVEGMKIQKTFSDAGGNMFISDKGEVFVLPGYLVEDNGTSRWYVSASKYYESNSEMEVPSGENSVVQGLQVGDYVNYVADHGSHLIDTSKTGGEEGGTLETQNTSWRVLSINNSTGKVLLTTDQPVNQVQLKGLKPFYYGKEELDAICEDLYSSEQFHVTARSITREDVDTACNFNKEDGNHYAVYPSGESPGGWITVNGINYCAIDTSNFWFDWGEFSTTDKYQVYQGGGVLKSGSSNTYIPTTDNPVLIEWIAENNFAFYQYGDTSITEGDTIEGPNGKTYIKKYHAQGTYPCVGDGIYCENGPQYDATSGLYYYIPSSDHPVFAETTDYTMFSPLLNPMVAEVLTNQNYWLATPTVEAEGNYVCCALTRTLKGGAMAGAGLWASWESLSEGAKQKHGIRPVVEIDATLLKKVG